MTEANIPPEWESALAEFDRDAAAIVAPLTDELNAKPPPPIIYHYTDGRGLEGILRSGKFWLTDVFHLNDPSELRHALAHAVQLVNAKAVGGTAEEQLFAKIFSDVPATGVTASAYYFVCSLSLCGDELGQWRAYADDGQGFALGFDAAPFNKWAFGSNSAFPVMYDDSRLAGIQQGLVNRFFPLLRLPGSGYIGTSAGRAYLTQVSALFTVHILHAASYFKNEAYKTEQEYRLLHLYQFGQKPAHVKYRSRPYSLVPYTEFDWRQAARQSLRRIVIGPSARHPIADQFLDDCLKAFHSGQVSVQLSKIPYRAL